MFPPDADIDPTNPSLTPSLNPLDPAYPASIALASKVANKEGPMLPPSEPKGVRYHATRLEKLEKGASLDSLSNVEGSVSGRSGASSPSRSRIGAAIAGTPCKFHLVPSL